ncbi:MAG: hypothetical protein KIT72_14940 [Polyangiaceae bacterium]|nr:hypothetical protein [Polyangiaceae bacterium]MCW5791712.1 hypothetical protein [Polyangiaceae bacterium]
MHSEPRVSQDLTALPPQLLGAAALPSRDFPALSTIAADERDGWRREAEAAGLIWIEVRDLGPEQRGGLALVIETAIEATLQQRGAGAPGFSSATHLDATLSDQLYRARTIGARGIAIRLRTLAGLTNLAGALDADDSSLLRWWMTATRERPVHLIFDARDRYLGVYTRPVALETLLSGANGKAPAPSVDEPLGLLTLEPWTPSLPALAADSSTTHDSVVELEAALSVPTLPEAVAQALGNLADEDAHEAARDARAALEGSHEATGDVQGSLEAAQVASEDVQESLEATQVALEPAHEATRDVQATLENAHEADDVQVASSHSLEAHASPPTTPSEAPEGPHEALEDARQPPEAQAATQASPPSEAHGEARQLAFRSVLAALEAMEQEDVDESPLAPSAFDHDADELTPVSAAGYDAPSGDEEDDEDLSVVAAPALAPMDLGDTGATDLLEALDVEPSPDGDGFTALLTNDDGTPLPVRPIARLSLFEDPPVAAAPESAIPDDEPGAVPSGRAGALDEGATSEGAAPRSVAGESIGASEDTAARGAVSEAPCGDDSEIETQQAAPSESEHALVPESTWRGWVRELVAARGPKPLAVVERLFASAYAPLQQARLRQPLDASADEALNSWSTAFSKSYLEAFDALRLRGKRPTMVLDVPEVALRHHRLHGARQVQLILVDGLRFDLGTEVHEHLRELAGRDAACVERLLLWSALPATTTAQIELIGRGPQGLREPPSSEAPMPVARGRAASTLRRVKAGYRDLMKLDLVESRVTEPGGATPQALSSLSREVAEVLWDHLASLPPRTLVMIFGDHGFHVDRETLSASCPAPGRHEATPEEILVPAYIWLTGSVH